MTSAVQIEGLDRLRATLRDATGNLDDLKTANEKAAQIVAQWAAVTAPRRTGALGAAVRGTRRAKESVIADRLAYAGPIHWGWKARHIEPQPFLTNAAAATQPHWLPLYLDDIQHILDRVRGA